MLIGVDASRANRKHRSGTEWYSYYVLRELAKLDSNNQYILYTDKPLRSDLCNLITETEGIAPEYDNQGYQIIKSPHNNFKAKVLNWPFTFLWTLGRLSLEMILRAPDVLFVPAHTLPIIHPKKSVVTIHDVGFERERGIYNKQAMGPKCGICRNILNIAVRFITFGRFGANSIDYLTWSTLYALRRASRIITVSNFSKSEIMDVYRNDLKSAAFEKIKVVHNGYNEQRYCSSLDKAKSEEVLSRYGISGSYLFYLGRIERKKNIAKLIEAFSIIKNDLPDLKLVLTGAAGFGYDEVAYMISEYGLDDRIIRTGWVDEVDLPYIFKGSKAFIFPSVYEGFGIPLIEAMGCGIPVACSSAPAVSEVVSGAALQFETHNCKSIADALLRICTDDDLRAKLKKNGYARAANFSWSKTAKETLEVLES